MHRCAAPPSRAAPVSSWPTSRAVAWPSGCATTKRTPTLAQCHPGSHETGSKPAEAIAVAADKPDELYWKVTLPVHTVDAVVSHTRAERSSALSSTLSSLPEIGRSGFSTAQRGCLPEVACR